MRAPRIRNYDTIYDKTTGNTENHLATDEMMRISGTMQNAYEEGFSSAQGTRGETAETGGRVRHPETRDSLRGGRVSTHIEEENSGLAES